jgi:hypothetical protein
MTALARKRPTEETEETEETAETALIHTLLHHQQSTGAINFTTWRCATTILGAEITRALLALHTQHPDLTALVLWTAAVSVLLRRDLAARRGFWELMLLKTAGYCAGCGGDVDVNAVVGRVLEGKRLLIRGRVGVAVETGGSDD